MTFQKNKKNNNNNKGRTKIGSFLFANNTAHDAKGGCEGILQVLILTWSPPVGVTATLLEHAEKMAYPSLIR